MHRSIAELLDSCRHVLAASLPPDLQSVVSELHAGDLGGIAAVISAERAARCARVEMLFLAQVGRGLLALPAENSGTRVTGMMVSICCYMPNRSDALLSYCQASSPTCP